MSKVEWPNKHVECLNSVEEMNKQQPGWQARVVPRLIRADMVFEKENISDEKLLKKLRRYMVMSMISGNSAAAEDLSDSPEAASDGANF